MAELQTGKFKSLFSWKTAYYIIYRINFDSRSPAQFFYPSHWTPGKILNTLMSKKHSVVLTSNHHIAMYFSYCRSALSLERYHLFFTYCQRKPLYLLPLAQVRERKPWVLLHVMALRWWCIYLQGSCKKKEHSLPHRLTVCFHLINLRYIRGHIPFSTIGCRGSCQEMCCFNILDQNLLMQQVTRSVIQCSGKTGYTGVGARKERSKQALIFGIDIR